MEVSLRRVMRGEVRFDEATRAVYATDASNYRQSPLGVIFPVDEADAVAAVRVCSEADVAILGRGSGTSLAGQACNTAVVIDFRRHFDKILEIDPVRRTARVQPGVVLDDLRAAAERHGLTFGPDPATHGWCTIGGMIGNNSCGTHALIAGKTVDNVERLRILTYDGDVFDVGAYDAAAYNAVVGDGGPLAAIVGGAREIARRYHDLIISRYPDIPRRVSGYNLDQLLPENGCHLARALVGTESTCALVLEAELRLVVSPPHRALAVLGYEDIYRAADDVPRLLRHPLMGLEGFDDTLVAQSRTSGLNLAGIDRLPPGGGWLLAELGGDDVTQAAEAARSLVAALPPTVNARVVTDPAEQALLWAIRESGLAATARPPDSPPNLEGWEDAAVPPERLGTYMREIRALWDRYGYHGAWYGHFGQGCVHTRNNFDLGTEEGLGSYRRYVEEAADLVVRLGGSLSGEHGDGQARGELLERMFGTELIDAFRMFKALWDPRGRMNPGKVVDAYPLDSNLAHGPDYRRGQEPVRHFALPADRGSLQLAAERCVGTGRCLRSDVGVMCPSYRATHDERHSTRGRARLLVEMFQGDVVAGSHRNDTVRDALDLCLGCKGCAVDCPTHVDMATYKAEFMARHYAGRLRPRSMYALGFLPWLARPAGRLPWLANRLMGESRLSRAVGRIAGVTTTRPLPRFAQSPLRRRRLSLDAKGPANGARTVVLWPDTFTNAYRPEVGIAALTALQAVGERVIVPTDWACCGRSLYDSGLLGSARRALSHLLDVLQPYVDQGLPVVVPEPSCLAAFRDELPNLLADDPRAARLASRARSLSEHLLTAGLPERVSDEAPEHVVVHPHCHQRATWGTTDDRTVLERLGYAVTVLDAGCCGLAGSFGFRAEHAGLSRKIAEEQWLPKVAAAGGDWLVLDGFSCNLQHTQLVAETPVALTTLAELVVRRVGSVKE